MNMSDIQKCLLYENAMYTSSVAYIIKTDFLNKNYIV